MEPYLLAPGHRYLGLVGCFVSFEDASPTDEIEKAAIAVLRSGGRPGASRVLAPTTEKKIGCRWIGVVDVAAPAAIVQDDGLFASIREHEAWEASRRCCSGRRLQTRVGAPSPRGGAPRRRGRAALLLVQNVEHRLVLALPLTSGGVWDTGAVV